MVLVHGYLGGSEQWVAEMERFSDRFHVIAPNLPGFGSAAGKTGYARIEEMANYIITLLDRLRIDDFVLLGHSMGGMIAQTIAAMVGHRVRKLILYGTGPLGVMPDRFEPIEKSREPLGRDGVGETIEQIGSTWFCRGRRAPEFDLVKQIGASASRSAALSALDAMSIWDGRTALKTMEMPTLIVWGDHDRPYRWPQIETLWNNLPNALLSVIPGTAHAAHLEKPKLFHAVLEDFLSE
ncbi:MAG: alpha/beta hydrolase [Pseudomonadota bacterium]